MWPFRKPPAIEQKSLAQPDPELLALFGATVPGTAAVSASVALSVPAVSAAVRVLSEAPACLNVHVQRKEGDAWVDDEAHPAWTLLRGDACEWSSGFELIRDLMSEALTRDAGGLAWVNRVDGKPVEIIRYRNSVITVAYEETGEPKYRLSGQPVPASDIIHLRGPFEKCPLNLAAEAIGIAHHMGKHAAKLFTTGARPAGLLSFPVDSKVGEAAVAKIKAGWKAAFGGANNGGETAVVYEGGTFTPLTFSSVDAQFQELRIFQVQEVARSFRVPPGMLYEMSRQTWANMTQATREFLVFSLEPWLRALEAALTRALIKPEDRQSFRIWFERDDLTRADLGERATAYSSLISSRIINPNTARDWEGLPPYPEGEAYANPAITPGAPANDNTPSPKKVAA